MKTRFSKNQAWNFGYNPSSYFETLAEEQKKILNLKDSDLSKLDYLFDLTLETPANKKIILDEVIDFAVSGYNLESMIASLVASNCKPFGELSYSMFHDIFQKEKINFLEIENKNDGPSSLIISRNEDLIEYYKKREFSKNDWNNRDLELGVMFGFPIAEVFGFVIANRTKKVTKGRRDDANYYDGLFYVEYYKYWSDEWRETVGAEASAHLLDIYYKSITNEGSLMESPLKILCDRNCEYSL